VWAGRGTDRSPQARVRRLAEVVHPLLVPQRVGPLLVRALVVTALVPNPIMLAVGRPALVPHALRALLVGHALGVAALGMALIVVEELVVAPLRLSLVGLLPGRDAAPLVALGVLVEH